MPRDIAKQGKNYVLYTDGCIRVDNVRLSHPHLDKPWKKEGDAGEPAYSASFLCPKSTHEEFKEVMKTIFADVEKEKKIKVKAAYRCLRDGDNEDMPGCGKPETAGMFLLVSREKSPPSLRDRDRANVPPDRATKVFYGGCYVNVLIRVWGQDNKYGQRLNANLLAVQFVKDGEPFGTGRITEDDVDDVFDEVGPAESRAPSRRIADDDDDL